MSMSPEEVVKQLKNIRGIFNPEKDATFERFDNVLTAAIELISSLPKAVEVKQDRPENGEIYNYVDNDGTVEESSWDDDITDNNRLACGNCYFGPNAKERAELEVRRRKLYRVSFIPNKGDIFYVFFNGYTTSEVAGQNEKGRDEALLVEGRIRATRQEAEACAKEEQEIAEELIRLNQ